MNIMITKIKNDVRMLTVSSFNLCKPFVLFKYHLDKTFLINLDLFPMYNNEFYYLFYEGYVISQWLLHVLPRRNNQVTWPLGTRQDEHMWSCLSVFFHNDRIETNALILIIVALSTHSGRVTHLCVSKQTIIGSDNGLSPGRRQAIIWTNAGILLVGPLGTKSVKS